MATITADEFQAILNLTDSDISNTNTEYVLDFAINLLNLYGADLSNMSGTAGSKTWSGESSEKGAIYMVARAAYYSFFKGIETAAIAGLSATSPDVIANPVIMQTVKEAAQQLTEMEVSVG